MRILIVSDAWAPQVNGVVRTYQNIIRELENMGHTVKVIGPADFNTFALPTYKEIRLSILPDFKLKRLIEDFKPEAIHIPVEGPLGWAARRYCLRRNIRYTTSYHTHFPDYVAKRVSPLGRHAQEIARRLMIWHIRRFHAPAKATFVATQSLEGELRAWGFKNRMVRLLRGADFTVFHPGAKKEFANLPKPILLYVGRISVEKNIEAFLDLDVSGTKVLVGHGPAEDDLKSRYPNVVFAGIKTGADLGAYYRSADIFVFPSKTDTFGMVLIEALASGLPIAAYRATGPIDIVTEDLLGAIDDNLHVAIQKALRTPGDAQARFEYTQAHYSWPAVANVFLETQKS
ncbi:MAG TPA: glycosyltransferase family 1 protein [Alphaproteobacteria bacterium]